MKYSNSIEGYCKSPMTVEQASTANGLLSDFMHKRKIYSKNMNFCLFIAMASTYLALYLNDADGFFYFFFLPIFALVIVASYSIFHDAMNVIGALSIKLLGSEMAVGDDFLMPLDVPCKSSVSSELGKQMIDGINAQDRKMFKFEKEILDKLCAF